MSKLVAVTARIGEIPYAITITDTEGHEWLSDEPPAAGGGERARLLEIANACPLHKVLTGEIRIATTLR